MKSWNNYYSDFSLFHPPILIELGIVTPSHITNKIQRIQYHEVSMTKPNMRLTTNLKVTEKLTQLAKLENQVGRNGHCEKGLLTDFENIQRVRTDPFLNCIVSHRAWGVQTCSWMTTVFLISLCWPHHFWVRRILSST